MLNSLVSIVEKYLLVTYVVVKYEDVSLCRNMNIYLKVFFVLSKFSPSP